MKESSADVRRVTAIRALIGDRLAISMGVDDLILEGIAAGAVGWVAGLVNALPRESVKLFEYGVRGETAKSVRTLSLVPPAASNGYGSEIRPVDQAVQQKRSARAARASRPPRMEVIGKELEEAQATVRASVARAPSYCGIAPSRMR